MSRGRFLRDTEGASAVEFALVAIPLLMLIFGTIEYGRLMWTRQALQESATSGARCIGLLSVNCATDGAYDAGKARAFVKATAAGWIVALEDDDIELDNAATCGGLTNFSRVRINLSFSTPVPEFLIGLSEGTLLSASSCFPNQSG